MNPSMFAFKLFTLGEQRQYQKGETILREGQPASMLFYVERGFIRSYYLKDGREITDWFGTAGTYLTSIDGFYNNSGSTQYVQCLENTVAWVILKSVIEAALGQKGVEAAYREVVVRHLLRLQERINALQFFTARERYELLLAKNPEAVQKAPRTLIASYLGISLETLSRVSGK